LVKVAHALFAGPLQVAHLINPLQLQRMSSVSLCVKIQHQSAANME